MQMVDQEVLKYLPLTPVAVGVKEEEASEEDPCDAPRLASHSDLRACTQILLRLAYALPADQVGLRPRSYLELRVSALVNSSVPSALRGNILDASHPQTKG